MAVSRLPSISMICSDPRPLSGANLNAASRQALMQKLARIDAPPTKTSAVYVQFRI